MSRHFTAASNDFITFNPGAMANPTFSGLVFAFLWRSSSVSPGGLFRSNNSGGTELLSCNPYSDGNVYVAWQGGGFIAANSYTTGVWYLDIVAHGNAAGAARIHRYNYTTGTWSHAAGSNGSQGAPTSGGNYPSTAILVGRYNGTSEDHDGDIAAIAMWSGGSFVTFAANSANDSALEALGLHTSAAAWAAQSPAVFWRFNQASTATPVTDDSATGTATQAAITGTSIGSDPPGFDYSLSSSTVYTDTSGGGAGAGSADTLSRTFVDTSGGGAGAGSSDTLSRTFVDTSGGSAGAGSPDALARTFVDTSGGSSAGGSSDTADHVLVDTSGGAASAGSPDQLTEAFIYTDTSGGAASAGSTDQLGAIYVDASGGGAGAGSPDTLARVFVDTSGGAAGAGSADTLPAARIYTDTSGGAAGAGSPDPSAATPKKQDTMVMPILVQAVNCLEQQAALAPNPPELYQVRPGTSAEPSTDGYGVDECCQGLAVVTLASNYEGEDSSWISPAGLPTNCPPMSWAVVLELKLLRCVPIASDRRGGNVTTAQWLAAAQQQADDGATLRRVLCCLRDLYGADRVAAGQVNPLSNQGGCGGVTLTLTVQADACDCVG